MQDMLRGSVLASMPFFDEREVIGLLDRLYAMDEGLGVANDQVLMIVMSAAVLHDRFRVSA